MSLFEEITNQKNSLLKSQFKCESEEEKKSLKTKSSVLILVLSKSKNIAKEKKLEVPTDEIVLSAIKQELKQLKQTEESCINHNRTEKCKLLSEFFVSESAMNLHKETKVKENLLLSFLPKQLTEDELTEEIKKVLKTIDTSNRGLVMKTVMGKLKNISDGKTISNVVNKLLTEKK